MLAQDAVKLLTMLSENPNKALNQLYSGPDKVVTSSNIHSYDWMELINNFGLVHDDPKTLLGKYDLSCSRSDLTNSILYVRVALMAMATLVSY